jgi:hypothetical protein
MESVLDMKHAIASLQSSGFASVLLDQHSESLHCSSFEVAEKAVDIASDSLHPSRIDPLSDSAHATGLHGPGGLSYYNAHRQGIVFSDGGWETFTLDGEPCFAEKMTDFFESAAGVAETVLGALEHHLSLEPGWFERNFGPIRASSQWHVKKYVLPSTSTVNEKSQHEVEKIETPDESVDGHDDPGPNRPEEIDSCHTNFSQVLLAMHTDPSLISVVLHHRSGRQAGAMGLEALGSSPGSWSELPRCGHGVASVLVGSVLERITSGLFPACRHRVVAQSSGTSSL